MQLVVSCDDHLMVTISTKCYQLRVSIIRPNETQVSIFPFSNLVGKLLLDLVDLSKEFYLLVRVKNKLSLGASSWVP